MEICKLEHIHKDYRMGEIVTPLKDVSLIVNAGDFIAVEGPSGIGKSTLLYVMGTLLQSDNGSYIVDGKDVSTMNDNEKSAFRAKKIGFMFQDSTMIQALTLRENLIFTQEVGGKKDLKKVDELLYQFGLDQDFTEKSLKDVVDRYVRLGLIQNMDNVDEIMDIAWTPVL